MLCHYPLLSMIYTINYTYQQQTKLGMQLATGRRIISAADDPAGLVITEGMTAQIRGLRQAQRNVLDGISLIQTAEGSISECQSMLQRMRELSVQATNGTYNDGDRHKMDEEFQALKEGIDQIVLSTEYNTIPLLDGSKESDAIQLQVGANAGNTINFTIRNFSSSALGLDPLIISDSNDAQLAMTKLSDVMKTVSFERSKLGAVQNRLEHTTRHLENYELNLSDAVSRIRDVDIAEAMMHYKQKEVHLHAIQAILAQAMKMENNRVLQLLESMVG